jgi:hypothetical protein
MQKPGSFLKNGNSVIDYMGARIKRTSVENDSNTTEILKGTGRKSEREDGRILCLEFAK